MSELEKLELVSCVDIEKGGIYIETTEDPRGWMFGDKTRKLYKASVADVETIMGLSIDVKTTPFGGSTNIFIQESERLSMMLLSKNDDVGSIIQYANIEASKPAQLTVKHGQHVCIVTISSNSIRVQIYPGVLFYDGHQA